MASTQRYIPYNYGEPLTTIPEGVEAESLTQKTFSDFPSEILSKILSLLAEFSPSLSGGSSRSAALDILCATHVNSSLRKVALAFPSLWRKILFLNGVHVDFFRAILDRSHSLPLCLSMKEDESLSTDTQLWSLLINVVPRLGSIHFEVGESYPGTRTKFLLTLLTVQAPVLEECSVSFLGQRAVRLNCFILDDASLPGGSRTPRLRRLELTNCFIPFDRCRLPQLSSITMRAINCEPVVGCEGIFLSHPQFRHLRQLVLWNSIQLMSNLNSFSQPIELPVLETFALLASGAVCKQLATILHIPSQCERTVTLLFPSQRDCTLGDAKDAAIAGSLFIAQDVAYTACALDMNDMAQSLKLSTHSCESKTRVYFIVNNSLRFERFGPVSSLLRAFANIPLYSWVSGFETTPKDTFSFFLWEFLASACKKPLASPSLLNISFGASSAAPYIFSPLFDLMTRVEMIAPTIPQPYANASFIHLIESPARFPQLQSLGVPLNRKVIDLSYIPQLLRQRVQIEKVVFCVSTTWLERAGYDRDAVRSDIVDGTRVFPTWVDVDWLED
ncbi:hypothetical protein EST38_g10091 [Candolleomyces aberdarensis]|uniref:Uncharacterized protein n=1 Tax=Candolleomyces aberdarensis TaxID=2316362 RepID=A0A4Q2D8A7_9AGAR|nr:hypothetical protein EST38_g10091 [Candolleomyces aberdarensis]